MKWLFQQLEGPVYVAGWEDREDCTVVDIPRALDAAGASDAAEICGNALNTLSLLLQLAPQVTASGTSPAPCLHCLKFQLHSCGHVLAVA